MYKIEAHQCSMDTPIYSLFSVILIVYSVHFIIHYLFTFFVIKK